MALKPADNKEVVSSATYESIPCTQSYGTSTIYASRVGNVVTLIIGAFNSAINDWQVVTTNPLPEKYRPSSTPQGINYYTLTSSGNVALVAVNRPGTIEIKK